MNLILLRGDDWIDGDCVQLNDRRAQHLREVLRAGLGDQVRVGLLGGSQGLAVIEAINAEGYRLRVVLTDPPPQRHRFDIVLALPRPKMLRRILRTVAEFGVANLHLIHSARVEKSFWQSPLLQPHRLEDALQAGLERARDTLLPAVHLHRRFRPFVEDQLADLCAERPCWITDSTGARSLAAMPSLPAVVMIGPEGGFVPFELDLAESVHAERVHLGARTLSVDTALVSVLAQALPG